MKEAVMVLKEIFLSKDVKERKELFQKKMEEYVQTSASRLNHL